MWRKKIGNVEPEELIMMECLTCREGIRGILNPTMINIHGCNKRSTRKKCKKLKVTVELTKSAFTAWFKNLHKTIIRENSITILKSKDTPKWYNWHRINDGFTRLRVYD